MKEKQSTNLHLLNLFNIFVNFSIRNIAVPGFSATEGQVIFSYDIVMDSWSMTGASWNTAYTYMGELPENLAIS